VERGLVDSLAIGPESDDDPDRRALSVAVDEIQEHEKRVDRRPPTARIATGKEARPHRSDEYSITRARSS
jgi:hypothetical protein